jgi:cellulose synthase/poly-beta-1,6-N-acetylglucosamine synthase-like glycosyltransferase
VSIVDPAFWITVFAIFLFFVAYTLASFGLLGISLVEVTLTKIERGEGFRPPPRLRRPGITMIAPVYNMEPLVVASVGSFLAVDYEPLELVVVDDGSADGTAAALITAFDLIELPVGDRLSIPTAPITALYVSRTDPRLRVVVKENGGRSDAINAGLNIARQELVALVDGDTLLEADSLQRIGEVFAVEPDDTVAVGGLIRVANGALIEGNTVVEPRVARSALEATQTAEYLRGFLGGRVAWARLRCLLIISGAFGVFRRDLLRAAGGLSKETLGEDMEIVLRLYRELRPTKQRMRIAYAPDANAWTEVPAGLAALRTQRIRWQAGLIDNVRMHRGMLFRPRYGAVGMFALPFAVVFELLGPLLQVAGYGILIAMLALHLISWWAFAAFLVVTVLIGQLHTIGAMLTEEVGFHRYRHRDLVLLGCWSLVELFWYGPLHATWRAQAIWLALRRRRPGWGSIPRGVAFGTAKDTELVSAPLPR